jgi:hypothetical protein
MLDIISIVKSVINQNGSINLERHFNLQYWTVYLQIS